MKKGIVIIGSLILIGAVGAGSWYYLKGRDGGKDDGEVVYVTKISTINGDDAGVLNRYAGVVEPQKTVTVNIENGRVVREAAVSVGDEVKQGQLLFEYDLSSIEDSLQEAKLALDRLKNEELSLNDQIATLEKEKKKASQSNQLSYTIEIETNKMNLKKNEYDQKSKEAEIAKLEKATGNTEVRSEIDGIIQKVDTSKLNSDSGDSLDESVSSMYASGDDANSNAFITILSTGSYRVKGKINEQNKNSILPGEPMIVRSRVDDTQIWHGVMGTIDEQNASSEGSSNMYGMIDSSGDSQTNSSSYPFYVDLDSSEGLMLGQHVYIEKDEGQEEKKTGLWLSEFYIMDADTAEPYVWAASDKKKLEKRQIVLGEYDEALGEYEIADGLTADDSIAFPSDNLTEGMKTADSANRGAGLGDSDEELSDEEWDGSEDTWDDSDEMASDDDLEYSEDGLEYSEDDVMQSIDDENGISLDEGTDDEKSDDESSVDGMEEIDEPIVYDSDDMEAAG